VVLQMGRSEAQIYGYIHSLPRGSQFPREAGTAPGETHWLVYGRTDHPRKVDVDLLNEHVARYTFAARLARGKRVLDAGCGAGYGSAELAQAADSVVGVDRAAEAIDFARASYGSPTCGSSRHPARPCPTPMAASTWWWPSKSSEHLDHWREFLLEARRVLAPAGQLVISTPNKLYYTESRGPTGANPFHVHEFDSRSSKASCAASFRTFPCTWRITSKASRFSRTKPAKQWKCGWTRATPPPTSRTSSWRCAPIAPS